MEVILHIEKNKSDYDWIETMHDMYTLITGTSSEIGRQTAIRLSESRRLVLRGRDIARLEETKSNYHPHRFGARGFNLYCASKGVLDGFMRAHSVELAPNVRVNSVLPGAIRTSMTDTMMNDSNLKSRFAEQCPLGIGKTSDVVSAIEFFISDKARWITGQELIVDGGRTVNITT